MIVKENDPSGRKWKYWFLELLSSLLVLAVCLGIPLLVLFKSEYPIFGAILLFLMFYVAGKINCVIENHIGIAMSNWNPNRANLVQWPPDIVPTWMKPKNTRQTDSAVSSCSSNKFPTFSLWLQIIRKNLLSILLSVAVYIVMSFVLWAMYFSGEKCFFIDDFAERVGYGIGRELHNHIFNLINTPILCNKIEWPILLGVLGCGIYYVILGVNFIGIFVKSRMSYSLLLFIWKHISIQNKRSKMFGCAVGQVIICLFFPGTNFLFWAMGILSEIFMSSSPSQFDIYWIAPLFIVCAIVEGISLLYVREFSKVISV